jgi:hypothetical protein
MPVLALASVAAVFSFGVLAVMILMVPIGLVGYHSAYDRRGDRSSVAWVAVVLPASWIRPRLWRALLRWGSARR